MSTASIEQPTVDAANPWPGLTPFTEEQKEFFHGRAGETDEMLRLVRRETLTVLFGQSGLGKTSMLQAGLFPLLRQNQLIPIYIRLDQTAAAVPLIEQVMNKIRASIDAREMDGPFPEVNELLWEYLHRKGAEFWTPRNRPATPVLVFDQFEELFTLGKSSAEARKRGEEFIERLAEVIENRTPARIGESDNTGLYDFGSPRCKVIIALREDFLPDLEELRNNIRSIMRNRMRITRLNGQCALEVVEKPGAGLVDADVAERIVRFVAGGDEKPDEAIENLEVEPALLSVICRELNSKRIAAGQRTITADLLSGNRTEILDRFYADCVHDIPDSARKFVEEWLLTPTGYRDSVALDSAVTDGGITRELIELLVRRRLLRLDLHHDPPRVELTHDRLTMPVQSARDKRRQIEAVKRAEFETQQARQKLNQARRRVIGAASVALVAVIFGISCLWELHRAEVERRNAELQQHRADEARRVAQQWIMQTLANAQWRELPALLKNDKINWSSTDQLLTEMVDEMPSADPRAVRFRLILANLNDSSRIGSLDEEKWMSACMTAMGDKQDDWGPVLVVFKPVQGKLLQHIHKHDSQYRAAQNIDRANFILVSGNERPLIEEKIASQLDKPAALLAAINDAGGQLEHNVAFFPAMPLEKSLSVHAQLKAAGYWPRQFRPYLSGNQVNVAAIYQLGGPSADVHLYDNTELLLADAASMDGYIPVDLCVFRDATGDGSLHDRYAVVWRSAVASAPVHSQLLLGVLPDEMDGQLAKLRAKWGAPAKIRTAQQIQTEETYALYGIATDDPLYFGTTMQRVAATSLFGPNQREDLLLLDVRPCEGRRVQDPASRWMRDLDDAEKRVAAGPRDPTSIILKAQAQLQLSQFHEALATVREASEPTSQVRYWRCLAAIRTGDLAQAQQALDEIEKANDPEQADDRIYLHGMLAAAHGEDIWPIIEKFVDQGMQGKRSDILYNAACVYAYASELASQRARRVEYTGKAIEIIGHAIDFGYSQSLHLQTDVDLKSLRGNPEFQRLISRAGANTVVTIERYEAEKPRTDSLSQISTDILVQGLRLKERFDDAKLIASLAVAGDRYFVLATSEPTGGIPVAAQANVQRRFTELRAALKYADLKAGSSARKWWDAFETENNDRPSLVLKLMIELNKRHASIEEFFLAYVYSNTDNIAANVNYLDFVRRRKTFSSAYSQNPDVDWFTDESQLADEGQITRKPVPAKANDSDAAIWWTGLKKRLSDANLNELESQLKRRNANHAECVDVVALCGTYDIVGQLRYLDFNRGQYEEDLRKGNPSTRPAHEELDVLRQYALARMLGKPIPNARANRSRVKTPADFENEIAAWTMALAHYPGEVGFDVVCYVSNACADSAHELMEAGETPNVRGVGVRLSKAARYLVHEKDITWGMCVRLMLRDTPSTHKSFLEAAAAMKDEFGTDFVEISNRFSMAETYDLTSKHENTEDDLRSLLLSFRSALYRSDLEASATLIRSLETGNIKLAQGDKAESAIKTIPYEHWYGWNKVTHDNSRESINLTRIDLLTFDADIGTYRFGRFQWDGSRWKSTSSTLPPPRAIPIAVDDPVRTAPMPTMPTSSH